jgi:hypothetical protein
MASTTTTTKTQPEQPKAEDQTKPVEQPKPQAVKVPERLKVRVALALTFDPKEFGIPEGMDLNQFRWEVRKAVAELIEKDTRFTSAKTETKVMPD